ncbi:MAG: hypothetical protein FWE07_05260 [Turicibacter sp.]|nr:hypothetical protein [Turicibacter sp.]
MEKTSLLLEVLKTKSDYQEVVANTEPLFIHSTLAEYLNELLVVKQLKKADVILKSGLERTYAYQIFSGKKAPARDKLIALAIGMQLTFEEVQNLFKVNGYAQLYPKNKRDNIIIFALYKGQSMMTLNDNLLTMGEAIVT